MVRVGSVELGQQGQYQSQGQSSVYGLGLGENFGSFIRFIHTILLIRGKLGIKDRSRGMFLPNFTFIGALYSSSGMRKPKFDREIQHFVMASSGRQQKLNARTQLGTFPCPTPSKCLLYFESMMAIPLSQFLLFEKTRPINKQTNKHGSTTNIERFRSRRHTQCQPHYTHHCDTEGLQAYHFCAP